MIHRYLLTAWARTPAYQAWPATAFAFRYEHLNDDGLFGGIAQRLQEATVTAERKFADGFLMRAEFRRDWSSQSFSPPARPKQGAIRTPCLSAWCGGLGAKLDPGNRGLAGP